ncbi:MAG: FeoA family protein [Coriobacteriales bacterium]|jgi:ferrous iron transport protein A
MPLSMVDANETVTITRISGTDSTRLHLAELGFVVGSKIGVVQTIGGNIIVKVKESRVALGKDLAMHVFVEEG